MAIPKRRWQLHWNRSRDREGDRVNVGRGLRPRRQPQIAFAVIVEGDDTGPAVSDVAGPGRSGRPAAPVSVPRMAWCRPRPGGRHTLLTPHRTGVEWAV